MMDELLTYLVRSIAGEEAEVHVIIDEKARNINIEVDKEHIGKVIGRGGKIAKAIRAIVKASAGKQKKRYDVDINEIGA